MCGDQPADAGGAAALARVEYELTEKGDALKPIIDEMRRFGHDWLGCEVHSA